MQTPSLIARGKNWKSSFLAYSWFERSTALLSFDQITGGTPILMSTAGQSGGDPVLSVPSEYGELRSRLIIEAKAGVSFASTAGSRFITADIYMLGVYTGSGSTEQGILIDGRNLGLAINSPHTEIDLPFTPSRIDFTNLNIRLAFWASFNSSTYASAGGTVHSIQCSLNVQVRTFDQS